MDPISQDARYQVTWWFKGCLSEKVLGRLILAIFYDQEYRSLFHTQFQFPGLNSFFNLHLVPWLLGSWSELRPQLGRRLRDGLRRRR